MSSASGLSRSAITWTQDYHIVFCLINVVVVVVVVVSPWAPTQRRQNDIQGKYFKQGRSFLSKIFLVIVRTKKHLPHQF